MLLSAGVGWLGAGGFWAAGFGGGFFAGVGRATGGGAAVSCPAIVSGAGPAVVSAARMAAVSDPDTIAVSVAGVAPDRRSPPHPATAATETRQIARSWTLQHLIVSSTLSVGGQGPEHTGIKIVSLTPTLSDAGHPLRR